MPEPMRYRKEREFGLSVGAVLVLIALYVVWRGRPITPWAWGGLGSALIILGAIRPRWLVWPCALWWRLAHAIGWVNARIILTVAFLLVLTPIGLILRLCGWDGLRLRHARATTNWVPYPTRLQDVTHYERMY